MDILKKLQQEFEIKAAQVENTVKLLDEGNTVPFIARYRKEMTGSLDDQIIRQLSERLTALRNLEEKREQVKNAIAEQGNLTEELAQKLDAAETQTEIDRQVVELVKKQHEKAVWILTDNRTKLDQLAQYLYEHETITGDEFMRILNA